MRGARLLTCTALATVAGGGATWLAFTVSVLDVDRAAWRRLGREGSNAQPTPGTTYVLVAIRAVNSGGRVGIPFVNGTLGAVGRSGRAHSSLEQGCGFIPHDVGDSDLVSAGRTVTVTTCWKVATSDAGSLVMYYEPYSGGRRTYFALR